ncbi:hypothetical protein U9M48_025789 [Paspalum notatum var. saurae]|uniref:Embryo surrounding factor 1 brassicaceae domain-containing protein n=1 Tax=Paspalum notatum var. saurae TaxID=547442 RepID=A0AAQ3TQN5_PASNO
MRAGSSNSFVYVVAICLFWLALLFGCLALSANCRSDHRLVWRNNTRGVLVSGSAGNATASHIDVINCFADAPPAAAPEEESKLTLIFCTYKCYCHNDDRDSICYCCQDGTNSPTCYDRLQDCQAHCPVCNPKCPPAPPATAIQG